MCLCVQSLSRVQLFENRMECSPPGSSVHGIFQARILEWVAISYSRDLPDKGIKPAPLALAGGFFYYCTTWEAPNRWAWQKELIPANLEYVKSSTNVAVNSCATIRMEKLLYQTSSRPVLIDLRTLESLKPLGTHFNISDMSIQNLTNINHYEFQISLYKMKYEKLSFSLLRVWFLFIIPSVLNALCFFSLLVVPWKLSSNPTSPKFTDFLSFV